MMHNTSSPTIAESQLIELVRAAQLAAQSAYNPYSHFSVGCALLAKSGKVYCGSNIENASYSVTICAERVAASQAIFQGDKQWQAMVVVSPQRVTPCGVCRQFLSEFSPDLLVWGGYLDNFDLSGPVLMRDLLPAAMTLDRGQGPTGR